MADITVKGFVSKSSVKEFNGNKFAAFTLAEGVKQKDGKYKNFYYNVTANGETAPEDGSRVEVQGWLKLREYGENKRLSLDIKATEVCELAAAAPKPTGEAGEPAGDPWENA